MAGICTSPYPIEKVRDSPYQSMWGFPVKKGTSSVNTQKWFICHLYTWEIIYIDTKSFLRINYQYFFKTSNLETLMEENIERDMKVKENA